MTPKVVAARAALALSTLAAPTSADVAVRPPACRRAAVAIAIDRSGSMTGRKLDDAKSAASAVVDRLGANDCVTVLEFDSTPTTVVPLQALSNPTAVKAAILRVQAGGGTEFLPALDAARLALENATASKKHVLFLSDGQAPAAGLQQLARTMSRDHITISTVALGSDADRSTLAMLSTTAGGRAYVVPDSSTLPHVFVRDIDALLAP